MSASGGKSRSTCPKCGALLQSNGNLAGQCVACLLEPASEEPVSAALGERFDHYQIAVHTDGTPVELGRGAMGVTYRAIDTTLGNEVALKVIDASIAAHPEARERFLREARAAARLRHPNVASVFYYGVRARDGQCFYAMELVDGETLEARLRRDGALPTALALEIVEQIASALVAADGLGLVHRDLKPANLMLVDRPKTIVKIIDFGLAKATSIAGSEADLTHGGFVGTPAFASPEQFTGSSLDVRSDLYSLGITLWDLLIGQTPFLGSPSEVMYLHRHAPLPLEQLKSIPKPVIGLVEVLLDKDPSRRFQSPTELLNCLPFVLKAIHEGGVITQKSLRVLADKQTNAPILREKFRKGLRIAMSPRLRLLVWPLIAILVCGGMILEGNVLFGSTRAAFPKTKASSLEITAPDKSIAVLPFDSLSDNKNDSYFADGVQGEILSNLAKVAQLKVISRTSVMTYRSDSKRDLRAIGVALDVAHVLEGTVRRDGNRVRITTELVDARTDRTLWSDSYDRDLTDIFSVQSEIAQTVVAKLSASLSPEEREGMQEKPTENFEAYDLYLEGKHLITDAETSASDRPNKFLHAIRLLEEAIQKDPTFALAYCQIVEADDWLNVINYGYLPQTRLHGDAALNEALRLKPNLPEVNLAAASHLYGYYRDYQRARTHLAIAQRGLPNSADAIALGAYLDRRQGHWAESTRTLEDACSLDPKNAETLDQLKMNYQCLHQYRDLERILNRLIALEPENPRWKLEKAEISYNEKAEINDFRSALGAFPASMRNNEQVFSYFVIVATLTRDWTTARELVRNRGNKEIWFGLGMADPVLLDITIAKYQGEEPERNAEFKAARSRLLQRVEGDPENAKLLSTLGLIDAFLGRKQDALQEAKSAVSMLPIASDAMDGPDLLGNLVLVYAWTNEADLAFLALEDSMKTPGGPSYGDLKLGPWFDPLRRDARFDKLLVQLAPGE